MTWPFVGAAFGGDPDGDPAHPGSGRAPRPEPLDPQRGFARDRSRRHQPVRAQPLSGLRPLVEDGTRITYGLEYQLQIPSWRVNATIGQSYSFSPDPAVAPDGTGLSHHTSDVVGRVEVQYRDFIQFTERFRLDKDTGAFRKNEFDATIGDHRTYLEVGYTSLNRHIQPASRIFPTTRNSAQAGASRS